VSGYRAAASRGGGEVFAPEGATQASVATPASPITGASAIEALLAMQAAGDALGAKKKVLRRGRALLDTLEEMQSDLLVGRVSEGRLNQLLAVIGQARERVAPGLDSLLDDIELRARVELAKFGRFSGL
jgi:Class II flagellar assembly regulator